MTTAPSIPKGLVPILKPSFVMGLFGERGSGKSAVMAHLGIKDWQRGRRIAYYPEDFNLDVPDAIPLGPTDLGTIPEFLNGATILVDEAQELLSKFRTGSSLSLSLLSLFRQVRKRGCSLIFTSNDPDGINRAVATQTDMHAECKLLSDPMCFTLGYHRFGCLDTVRLRVRDTNGKYGRNRSSRDGRKGYVQHIVGISRVYPLYNTASIADLTDVISTGKAELLEHKQAETLGMTWEAFDQYLVSTVIPELVNNGGETITPKNFSKYLKDKLGVPIAGPAIAATIIGTKLKGIGLTAKRGGAGMVYTLPPPDRLDVWQAGLWSPGDDY